MAKSKRVRLPMCKFCNVKLDKLVSVIGDPEGIRNDRKCPKCGAVFGYTRSSESVLLRPEAEIVKLRMAATRSTLELAKSVNMSVDDLNDLVARYREIWAEYNAEYRSRQEIEDYS